jgi:hypothetical protein
MSTGRDGGMPSKIWLRKGERPAWTPVTIDHPTPDGVERFDRIRCPLCRWHPTPSSRWSCLCIDTPEPFFESCGTTWNTFTTRGRCPGCGHQWQWTSCLRCGGWSLHDDWYEDGD